MKKINYTFVFFLLLVMTFTACNASPNIEEKKDIKPAKMEDNVLYKKPNPNQAKQKEYDERVAKQKAEHAQQLRSSTYQDHLLTMAPLNNSTLFLEGTAYFSYDEEKHFNDEPVKKYGLKLFYTFTNKGKRSKTLNEILNTHVYITQTKQDVNIGDAYDFSFSSELRKIALEDITRLSAEEYQKQNEFLESDMSASGVAYFIIDDPSQPIYVYVYEAGYPDLDVLVGVEETIYKETDENLENANDAV